MKNTQINGKLSHVHGSEKLILLKCPYYPKPYIDSVQSLSKFQWYFFTEVEERILQFIQNYKRPQIANTILRKNNKAESLTLPDFKLHYKAIVTKTVWHCHNQIDQWNRTGNLEINLHVYGQLIFDKGATNIKGEKDSLQ
uniref:Uncharacterized protein n=1 Tax=Rousettus aegyptiacus TaxID=9407 RepID=A0A7J8CHW8_ROUAE|nr:hypothetical protein HJG63_008986 [Rousettus aegyptiacus]